MAARGLAVVTCFDTRMDPLAMLGLKRGDAKILRNLGGRVTPDALRSLMVATAQLGIHHVAVVHHTDCAANQSPESIRESIFQATGKATDDIDFRTFDNDEQAVRDDMAVLHNCAQLGDIAVAGFLFDVDTGQLNPVAESPASADSPAS